MPAAEIHLRPVGVSSSFRLLEVLIGENIGSRADEAKAHPVGARVAGWKQIGRDHYYIVGRTMIAFVDGLVNATLFNGVSRGVHVPFRVRPFPIVAPALAAV